MSKPKTPTTTQLDTLRRVANAGGKILHESGDRWTVPNVSRDESGAPVWFVSVSTVYVMELAGWLAPVGSDEHDPREITAAGRDVLASMGKRFTNATRAAKIHNTTADDATWEEALAQAEELHQRHGGFGKLSRSTAIREAIWSRAPRDRREAAGVEAPMPLVSPQEHAEVFVAWLRALAEAGGAEQAKRLARRVGETFTDE